MRDVVVVEQTLRLRQVANNVAVCLLDVSALKVGDVVGKASVFVDGAHYTLATLDKLSLQTTAVIVLTEARRLKMNE
jgi:hypothetical protein